MNPAIINTIARQQQEIAQFEKDFLCSGAPDKRLAYDIAEVQQALLAMKFRLESLLADRPELFLVVIPLTSGFVSSHTGDSVPNLSDLNSCPDTSGFPEAGVPNFHESDRQEVPEPVVSINNLPKENIETIRE